MEGTVLQGAPTPPPVEGVLLDLSVSEYRVLRGLVYNNLSGTHPLRSAISRELDRLDNKLGAKPSYTRGRRYSGDPNNIEGLLALFA